MNAQNFLYKGYIYSNGTPLVGASVYINSFGEGVTSNQNGFFLISTDIIPSKLTISYVGYKTKTIIISKGKYDFGIIELVPADSLEEFVISGTLKPVSKLDSPVPVEVYGKSFFRANPTASIF